MKSFASENAPKEGKGKKKSEVLLLAVKKHEDRKNLFTLHFFCSSMQCFLSSLSTQINLLLSILSLAFLLTLETPWISLWALWELQLNFIWSWEHKFLTWSLECLLAPILSLLKIQEKAMQTSDMKLPYFFSSADSLGCLPWQWCHLGFAFLSMFSIFLADTFITHRVTYCISD